MPDGGYDEGYVEVDCFWGHEPAGMVRTACTILGSGSKKRAIDLGCGEGKNAAAMAAAGFRVLAIDKSEAGLENAISLHDSSEISWLNTDLLSITGPAQNYDLAIATGSFHCLKSEEEVSRAIQLLQLLVAPGGLNVLYSFNNGTQDLSGHSSDFHPILLAHTWYLEKYQYGWEILEQTNITQPDIHPHNNIPHHHTITRILAKKLDAA